MGRELLPFRADPAVRYVTIWRGRAIAAYLACGASRAVTAWSRWANRWGRTPPAEALALRVLADRLEQGEAIPEVTGLFDAG